MKLLLVLPLLAPLLANTDGAYIPGMLQFGVLGIVLGWFMFRLEAIIKDHTKALEKQSRTLAIVLQAVAGHPQVARDVGTKARKALEDLGASELEASQ